MATPALATVDELMTRITAIDTTSAEFRALLYQCLVSSTIQISSIFKLGSFEEAVSVVDTFVVGRDEGRKNNRFLKFRLNHAFVNQTTTPIDVRFGITEDDLDDATPLLAPFFKVDEQLGYVDFDTYGFDNDLVSVVRRRLPRNFSQWFFRITYDHGLAKKTTSDGKVFKNVPDWLREACLIKAREIYQLSNPAKDVQADLYSGNFEFIMADKSRRGGVQRITPIIEV